MDERTYFSLTLIRLLLQLLGYLSIIIGVTAPLFTRPWLIEYFRPADPALAPPIDLLPYALNGLIVFTIVSMFIGILLIASGQKIKVIIDTEENTRTTTNHLSEIRSLLHAIHEKIK